MFQTFLQTRRVASHAAVPLLNRVENLKKCHVIGRYPPGGKTQNWDHQPSYRCARTVRILIISRHVSGPRCTDLFDRRFVQILPSNAEINNDTLPTTHSRVYYWRYKELYY